MTREVLVKGKRLRLTQDKVLGEGGEADVYDVRNDFPSEGPYALKVWKPPDHPDFRGDTEEAIRNREAAKLRLREYAEKLVRFPTHLPERVVRPLEPAYARLHGPVLGYLMKLIEGTRPLRFLAQKGTRQSAGIGTDAVVQVFQDLHRTVSELHRAGVVIGDFNYLNVLVRNLEAFVIDADSMQFGPYLCRSFTTRFVDPLICDARLTKPVQIRPHSELTDWYAYAVMLFESLLWVHPYLGGIYEPKEVKQQMPQDARPLKRISVFHPGVVYPSKAMPLTWLPSRVRDYFGEILEHEKREAFPQEALDILLAHAQGRYVDPARVIAPSRKRETIRGKAHSRRVRDFANATILKAVLQAQHLALVYHEGGQFKREDGQVLMSGSPDPQLRYRIAGQRTLIGLGSRLAVFEPGSVAPLQYAVDQYQGKFGVFDGNAKHRYWLQQGQLLRDEALGPKFIGSVLQNQTLFWVGPRFGFGFYRAAGMTVGFVFDAERSGINDSIALPPIRGELIDANCVFSEGRAWFFTTTLEGGAIKNRCLTISPSGKLSAIAEASEDDGSWLGSIRGKCAARIRRADGQLREILFAATDTGVVAIEDISGVPTESARYPDTRGFVPSDARIFFEPSKGFWMVRAHEVRLVEFPL